MQAFVASPLGLHLNAAAKKELQQHKQVALLKEQMGVVTDNLPLPKQCHVISFCKMVMRKAAKQLRKYRCPLCPVEVKTYQSLAQQGQLERR